MKISEMGVLKMIDAIDSWQKNDQMHPLTCDGGGKCSSHGKLIAKIRTTSKNVNISGQEGSEIFLVCPECGFRQEYVPDCVYQWYIDTHNHSIPIGQVVELEITEDFCADNIYNTKPYIYGDGTEVKADPGVTTPDGVDYIELRFVGKLTALVVGHSRDCDGTPLYFLSDQRIQYPCDNIPEGRSPIEEFWEYKKWSNFFKGGISGDSLKVLEGQFVPMLHNSIFEYEEWLNEAITNKKI